MHRPTSTTARASARPASRLGGRRLVGAGLAAVLAAGAASSCASPQLPELTLSPSGGTIATGQSVQLTATRKYPGADSEIVTSLLDWSSSNTSVLTVSNQAPTRGLVTGGLAAPVVFVRATDPLSGVERSVTFTVTAPEVTSILVTPSPAVVLGRGQSRPLTATATMSDGSTADVTQTVLWASSNLASVSIVDTGKERGRITAVSPGRADVTATDPRTKLQGTTSVFVSGSGDVRAVTVAPNPGSVQVGQTLRFVALAYFADGSTQELTQQATWLSSTPAVATAAAAGVVTGVAAGATTITAVDPTGQARGSALLTVTP